MFCADLTAKFARFYQKERKVVMLILPQIHRFHVIFRDEVNNYANPRDENSPVISVKWCFLSVDYPNFLFSDREGDLRKNLKEELTKKIPQVD